ncbi:MAG TPA: extracellular solute-binding protein [Candidatus Acidoferrales bacterium]|nr:extracellular solute-binding protein [Candidatus Acidoferrales bacterium]
MKLTVSLGLALVAVFGLYALPALAASADVQARAEAEGKMVFYAVFNANDSKALIDAFRKDYPKIDAAFYRATDAQMMQRILNEGRAGKPLWDVAMVTSFYGYDLKKRGFFAPYDSPERKFYREGYKDPDAAWTSVYTNYGAFGYNTRAVPKSMLPKTYDDLLKPEWQGHLTIAARAYEWFATMIKAMGEERGLSYMRALARQVRISDARTLIAQFVAAGEFKGALSAYSSTFEQLKPAGAPVDWLYLNPVFANIHPMGLSAKAPNPNAGKLFIDFVLSKKGQTVIKDLKRIPDRVDVVPDPPRLIEGIKPAFAPPEVLEQFEHYAKQFNDIFGGK